MAADSTALAVSAAVSGADGNWRRLHSPSGVLHVVTRSLRRGRRPRSITLGTTVGPSREQQGQGARWDSPEASRGVNPVNAREPLKAEIERDSGGTRAGIEQSMLKRVPPPLTHP